MRTRVFGMAGTIAVLVMVASAAAGNRSGLIGVTLQSPPSEQAVVRDRKGDRLPTAIFAHDQRGPAVDAPPAAPVAKPRPDHKPALLRGCEPALSPLTGAALTGLHARCVADAGTAPRPLG